LQASSTIGKRRTDWIRSPDDPIRPVNVSADAA
jgi:hypothetical protein